MNIPLNNGEIASWIFSVQVKAENPNIKSIWRAFICGLYSDNSIDFYSFDEWKALHAQPAYQMLKLWSKEQDDRAASHREEFSVRTRGIDQVIVDRILWYEQMDTDLISLKDAQEQTIDEMLEPYFWTQINPFLPSPYVKPD